MGRVADLSKDMGKDFRLKSDCEWLMSEKLDSDKSLTGLLTRLGFDNTNNRLTSLIERHNYDIHQKLVRKAPFTAPQFIEAMKTCENIGEVAKKLGITRDFARLIVHRDYPQYASKLIRKAAKYTTLEQREKIANANMKERKNIANELGISIQTAHNIAYNWRKKNDK